jgi:hypothetical protein
LPTLVPVPVAIAGVVSLVRDRAVRPLGWKIVATVLAFFVLGGTSYYALPVVVFALAAGSIPLDRRLTPRRLRIRGSRLRRSRPRRPAEPATGAAVVHGPRLASLRTPVERPADSTATTPPARAESARRRSQ